MPRSESRAAVVLVDFGKDEVSAQFVAGPTAGLDAEQMASDMRAGANELQHIFIAQTAEAHSRAIETRAAEAAGAARKSPKSNVRAARATSTAAVDGEGGTA